MTISRWSLLAAVLGALTIGACDGGTDDDTPDGGAKDSGLPCLESNFTSIYGRLSSETCATVGCHDAVSHGGDQNYDLSKDTVHATLLGDTLNPIGAADYPKRVVAGQPDDSFLWIKISRDDAPSGRMPLANTPLQQCDLDAIRTWIMNGAMND
jgi:hypothetical protein